MEPLLYVFPDNVVFPDTFNELFIVVIFFNNTLPFTVNEELQVVILFNIVVPDTYNELLIVVILFNVVLPETFNDDPHVVILFNVVFPETVNVDIHVISYIPFVYKAPLKTAGNLVVLSVDVQSNLPVGFIETTGFVAFCINFVLSAINNNLVLILLAPNNKAIPSVDVVEGTKYS